MKIKYLTCLAGTNHVRNIGDILDTPDDEAGRLIEAGFAEIVPEETPPVAANQDDAKPKKKVK